MNMLHTSVRKSVKLAVTFVLARVWRTGVEVGGLCQVPIASTLEHDWFQCLVCKVKKKAQRIQISRNCQLLKEHVLQL